MKPLTWQKSQQLNNLQMHRYCLALDLKDDPSLIAEYINKHRNVSPVIKSSIREAGITNMILYNVGNRLFMIMETDDNFSFEKKAAMDASNPQVQEWEALVLNYQQPLPQAKPGEKWLLMDKIFELKGEEES